MIRLYERGTFNFERMQSSGTANAEVVKEVSAIIASVRKWGDESLREYGVRFDGTAPDQFEVTRDEIEEAVNSLDPALRAVLEEAAANIRAFHRHQVHAGFTVTETDGVILGQRVLPLERVGIYVPGGTAAYPSTVLMNAIPASIAGVPEIIMASPPSKDGTIQPALLAAAHIAGVHRIFKTGGAQAIAALACGTESVPRVDKITGPGNVYVAEAKRQVFGQVGIDMIAGPSEVMIVADESADASLVAADMIAQAEHDKNATAVLVTDCDKLASDVKAQLEEQLDVLPRREIALASIENNGMIILVNDMHEALDIANRVAPEHLELFTAQPFDLLNRVHNAGSVFLGGCTPEPMGDYFAGVNHTLPTAGAARFSSPLSVDDFVKKMQFSYYTKEALLRDAGKVALFAQTEGLQGHATAVEKRSS